MLSTLSDDRCTVLELPFADHNGEDLGSYSVDAEETVGQMVQEIVEESGLPLRNPDGSPRRYEAFQGGRKLAPASRVREAELRPGVAIEVYPSVVTG